MLAAWRQELSAEDKELFIDIAALYIMKKVFFLPTQSPWAFIMENAKPGDTRLKIDSTLFTVEKSKSRLKRALPDNYYSRLSLGPAKLLALFDAVKPINNAEKA